MTMRSRVIVPSSGIVLLVSFFCQKVSAFSVRSPPELVVESQLAALRKKDFKKAYEEFFSIDSKEVTGDSWESFEGDLQDEAFQPIWKHSQSTVLMVTRNDPTHCSCLVRVVATPSYKDENKYISSGIPLQYWWGLSLENEEWKVESLEPDFEGMDIEIQVEEVGEDEDEFVIYLDENGNLLLPDGDDEFDDDDEEWTTY